MSILISIDPSINQAGVALFDLGKKHLIGAELVTPSKTMKDDFHLKVYSVYKKILRIVEEYEVDKCAMEIPEHWARAGFIARESGAIFKLSFMCGGLFCKLSDIMPVKLVVPKGWKGQMNKDVVRNRLARDYIGTKSWQYTKEDWEKLNHNILDGIGIGHWYVFGRV